jgi:hypothetical protein
MPATSSTDSSRASVDKRSESHSSQRGGVPLDETLARLGAARSGLAEEEAAKQRLVGFGYNEIAERKVHPIVKPLSYFLGGRSRG